MITFLIGTIESTTDSAANINVNGVGYEVLCPTGVLTKCDNSAEVKLLIHHHITEANQALYGFVEESQRVLFRMLIAISGVGPKAGLSILTTLTPNQIADAVATQSGKIISQANGVGPKLGERVVVELKSKLGKLPTSMLENPAAPTGNGADVISALMNMGFKENQAQPAVASALKAQPDVDFNALLKASLQSLR